ACRKRITVVSAPLGTLPYVQELRTVKTIIRMKVDLNILLYRLSVDCFARERPILIAYDYAKNEASPFAKCAPNKQGGKQFHLIGPIFNPRFKAENQMGGKSLI
ncbi:MAG: hypothetical protein ABJ034_15855, partial [Hyphomicrobiales bacterium]